MRMTQRLALLGLGVTLGIGLILAVVQYVSDFQRYKKEFIATQNQIINLIKPSATRAVYVSDNTLAMEVVNGLLRYDFINSAQIEDLNGSVLASSMKPHQSEVRIRWVHGFVGEQFQDFSTELAYKSNFDEVIGRVVYRVDMIRVYDSLYKSSLTHLAGDIFLSLLLISALYIAFYFYFTRPVLRLAEEMKTINFYKPGSRRFTRLTNRSDELGQLVDNGNRLLESVELALDSQRSVEVALRRSEEHLRELIDCLPVYVAARNRSGYIVFANKAWASVFGLNPDQLRYVQFDDVVSASSINVDEILRRDRRVLETKNDFIVAEEQWYNNHNQPLFWQSHYTLFEFNGEEVVLVVSTDISDRKKSEADIAFMAYHDSLTKLPNRVHLVDRLEKELHRSRRHHYYGAVLFIDLDQFKNINDSLGHPVGDVLLIEVARRLEEAVRDEDLVARLGGDEFVLVLTLLDSTMAGAKTKAACVGEKIRACLSEPVYHDNIELRVTCSIGAVLFPEEGVSVHELLRYADTAMYQVKDGGRNSIAFFNESMANVVKTQLLLETQLHKAVEEKQFVLMFQPKVDVKTGHLTGAEVLLRWQHPAKGIVLPGDFIGTLESLGLIVQVGQWLFEQACLYLHNWQQQGIWQTGMKLSINVSPRQFRHTGFVDDVQRTLEKYPFCKNAIDFEVTENVVIGSIEETANIMQQLCDLGVTFSLDDFGTGYSSISYLKNLPVSSLKIDKSFVRDIRIDRNDKVLVESMATMGRLLGLRVVAEGVEEQEQLGLIKEFGCDEYQGFYYRQPMLPEDFKQCLQDICPLVALK